MLKNHLKIAWRSLKNQPFFTFLNTFGLAIGMAGALLIGLYIHDELSYDKMFADADRIHRMNIDLKFGGNTGAYAQTPPPLAQVLMDDYSQVELATRFRTLGGRLVKTPESEAYVKEPVTAYVDSTFFKMFGVPLLSGDVRTALNAPNSLVLTKTAAKRHFGSQEALGKILLLDNNETHTVTGIVEDFPKNSFLRDYSMLLAMSGYEDSRSVEWGGYNYQTYIKLIPSARIDDLNSSLQAIVGNYVMQWAQRYFPGITEEQFKAAGNYMIYSTIPFTDIHLHSNRIGEVSANSSVKNVYILFFIALFLIVLASVNFMNLATAQSLKRAKEVGIRKTLGSNKGLLRLQFLTESGLISFLSLFMAIALSVLALPIFNQLSGKTLTIAFANPLFWILLVGCTFLLGLLSGCYPAFFMSRFLPAKVLKGSSGKDVGGGKVRNALVIFQFAVSIFLIIATLVVYQQLSYIQKKDLGYSKDQVLVIQDIYGAGQKVRSFKEEVKKLGTVKDVTLSSFLPSTGVFSSNTFALEGVSDANRSLSMQVWDVDEDYVSTMELKLIAGRDFDLNFPTDSTGLILNESAVKILGVDPDKAIGTRLTPNIGAENPRYLSVIGVVKDFNFESLHNIIGPLGLGIGNYAGSMAVKLQVGDFSGTIAQIESIWNTVAPGLPFQYNFMDDSFNQTYEADRRLGQILIAFTILSILIACLGLFGLASFNAQKRVKEIGVRKVLGASVEQITYRLSMDFLKLVFISIAIALPLGWFAMDRWLQDFAFRINIPWWALLLAGVLAITIALVTISYQSIKAAIANPVKSLRTE